MSEKPPIYNESGQVIDPDLAHEAADIEAKAHEQRTFGIFKPSRRTLRKGELMAELAIEEGTEIDIRKLPDVICKEIDRCGQEVAREYEGGRLVLLGGHQSDIGEGVSRCRLIAEVTNEGMPPLKGIVHKLRDRDLLVMLTIDVNVEDSSVLRSHIEEMQ